MEVLTNFIWRKYTNPWSIWVRFFILPMLIISMWSRIWFGQWSLLLLLFTLAWIWFNPRLTSTKKTKNIWAMQAVLGERLWLNRHSNLIPEHHFFVITALQIIVIISFLVCLAGIIILSPWITFFGLSMTYVGMCWFLDRMVWLYNDDKAQKEKVKIKLLRQQRKRKLLRNQIHLEKLKKSA
ncbi:MAG: DUF6653 family protein [Gammaproteobacteria bacterium]